MGLLDGKRGIVFGVANDRSYAWFIAKELIAHGAECVFTHLPDPKGKMERRCRGAINDLGIEDPWLVSCDVSSDEDMDAVFDKLKEDFGKIDFVVHAVAYADREYLKLGNFHKTSREAWAQALDISAYSLLAMTQRAEHIMPDGGSIIAMSYYGGEKVCPGYNLMGIAKAALEHTARYLAYDMGPKNIRVNTISAGPLASRAAIAPLEGALRLPCRDRSTGASGGRGSWVVSGRSRCARSKKQEERRENGESESQCELGRVSAR